MYFKIILYFKKVLDSEKQYHFSYKMGAHLKNRRDMTIQKKLLSNENILYIKQQIGYRITKRGYKTLDKFKKKSIGNVSKTIDENDPLFKSQWFVITQIFILNLK